LKSLTGKVLDDYKSLFSNVTGSSSVAIKSDVQVNRLVSLCSMLLALYEKEDYRTTFPELENVVPIRDSETIDRLNDKLVDGMREKSQNLYLTVPDIIDYRQIGYFANFSGAGASLQYPDVFIDKYYEYLESHHHRVQDVDLIQLTAHRLKLTDGDGKVQKSYSLFKCLIFDTTLDDGTQTFHLTDGQWYKVQNSYIARLKAAIDPLCFDINLPCYDHKDEDHYNASVAAEDSTYLCLHKSSIAPSGQTMIEPCDLYSVEDDTAVLHHIKRSTVSTQLSHLFNQGINSIEMIKGEAACLNRLKEAIAERATQIPHEPLLEPLDKERFSVVFGIVTHKDRKRKSENLPLFSRVSLMRIAKRLRMYGVDCRLGFIEDRSESQSGIKRKRKAGSSKQVKPTVD
jgi:uncharacterized protein (TIGR04141 family)